MHFIWSQLHVTYERKKYIIYISDKNILELLESDLNLEYLIKKYKGYSKKRSMLNYAAIIILLYYLKLLKSFDFKMCLIFPYRNSFFFIIT